MKLKRITALILAVLMLTALCACEATEPIDDYVDGQGAGKDLGTISAADDIFTVNCNKGYSFNPLVATNTNNQLVCNLVYENIVELDNNYNVLPNVATSWETTDGQNWVFHVDTERYFHDGSKMTAADIAYSVKCAVNSDRFRGRFSYVYGCSAADENTFVVYLGKPNMMFPMLLCIPIIKSGSYNDPYPQGTGPYTYTEDYSKLVAFEKYPGYGKLPVDTIYLSEYSGGVETISAFEDSLIDVVMNDPTAPTNLGYGTANEIRGFNTTNFHYVGFSSYSTVFSYDAMRLAMSYAFDRDYLKAQMGGFAEPTAIPVNPACPWYDEELNSQYTYNLDVCRNIFKNLGFDDFDQDGYYEMKSGDGFTEVNIRFLVCADSGTKVNVARKFAQDMDSMGIQVTLLEYTWKAYQEAIEAGNFDMFYAETRVNPDFDMSRLIATGGALNFGQWYSDTVDGAIAAYLQSDDENRATACRDMCTTVTGGGYIIPLCFEKHQMITHRGVIIGVKVNENNPLMNVANWQISFSGYNADGEKNTD